MQTSIMVQESQLKALLNAGQTAEAVKLLSKMAIQCAQENDFDRAESFRDQLYEVDSMALSLIVRVNEIIENEKGKTLTPDLRRLWGRFFAALSTEEANAFFFALKETTLDADQVVLQQGQHNERLYLINQGKIKIVHDSPDKQILIQTLGPGDYFAEDTFFSINVCTASAITLLNCKLSYLERDKIDGLAIQFPMLEKQLQKICGTGNKIYSWLRQKGIDRRAHKRINFTTRITFQILTTEEGESLHSTVNAELWDISKSGLSFYFQSKSRQAVRRLVGRTLGVRFNLIVNGKEKEIALTGIVQGVQDHPLDEYSVHMKLRRVFTDESIRTIQRIAEGQ
jgi:CRP-like cAMP-binding protein